MDDLCGARTRAGGSCRRRPVHGRRRCNLHGGKSRAGFAHPNYKHGRYSKYGLERIKARARAREAAWARDLGLAVERWERQHPGRELPPASLLRLSREVREYHRRRGWFVTLS